MNVGQHLTRSVGELYCSCGVFNKKSGKLRPEVEVAKRLEDLTKPQTYIERAFDIRKALVSAKRGCLISFVVQGRVTVGTGNPSPTDIGMTFDWTSGWPIIPGSAVKGATKAWVEHHASFDDLQLPYAQAEEEELAEHYLNVFGAGPEGDEDGIGGGIDFLDILFSYKADIVLDVMAPHYGNISKQSFDPERDSPADWNDPDPLYFLAIEAGSKAVGGLVPAREFSAVSLNYAKHWMQSALVLIGVGAKTSDGRGRLVATPEPEPGREHSD